jgi:hypothetical protein
MFMEYFIESLQQVKEMGIKEKSLQNTKKYAFDEK